MLLPYTVFLSQFNNTEQSLFVRSRHNRQVSKTDRSNIHNRLSIQTEHRPQATDRWKAERKVEHSNLGTVFVKLQREKVPFFIPYSDIGALGVCI